MAQESVDGSETGGILLGRGPDKTSVVHVERAGDAGPKAHREPGFFLRDLEHAQRLADEAWDESKAIWVGEWHTHIHGDSRPSATDLGTYARLLAATDLRFDVFVSIIVVPDAEHGWEEPWFASWLLAISDIPVEAARRRE